MSRACLLLFVALTAACRRIHIDPGHRFAGAGLRASRRDGKTHKLNDYAATRCSLLCSRQSLPHSQLYEDRIKRIAADYRGKGVALVPIQPNDPNALRVDEMVMSDMSDSLEEMKIRAEYGTSTSRISTMAPLNR